MNTTLSVSPSFRPYSTDNYRVEDSLGHLIVVAHGLLLRHIDQRMEPFDITSAQWKVLIRVLVGDVRSSSALCRELGCDTGAMTRMLDRLEEKGFVHRERSHEDRRLVLVTPTESSRVMQRPLVSAAVNALNDALSDFSVTEFALLKRLLSRLIANLNP
ncbi:MarR family winged helix-turn-helix transcriptional regulator [Burkholderia lata]|uniref:MarR family transcriptional regulator n=1 Tax=Burkholderia lata (strain ATCC 17760 / DSM 23089 / LMG 22485 / NCIMB 9086 / R18194 / 383) TaxID=482957 RepID=A0A6P2U2T9_BURL3|nr:MarR family transcriptional regulator [Burkholderia lata]VWC63369.1 MarR family transcriptional regulator [Burkholderia lata]